MAKRIKMVIYGEPGVGKSVFACKAPKPFFITTDGNYEWLEDFGAKEEDHIQVSSWSEAKKVFKSSFDGYETIVLDLTEDLFKWCEFEYCEKNRFEHVSDIGFGKGYDITRNEFFIEMCKLISLDKNIIFIMHGQTVVVKDRRGVEHTTFRPTSRIPDKVIDMLEGRVRYFLRCYLKAEEQADGTIIKKRYLSLIPKENEFGIHRGVDETKMPEDIPLSFDEFTKAIGFETKLIEKKEKVEKVKEEVSLNEVLDKNEETEEVLKPRRGRKKKEETTVENSENIDTAEEVKEETSTIEINQVEEVVEQSSQPKETKALTQAERIAAIKAALAAKK